MNCPSAGEQSTMASSVSSSSNVGVEQLSGHSIASFQAPDRTSQLLRALLRAAVFVPSSSGDVTVACIANRCSYQTLQSKSSGTV